jgi:hypothetical protein
MVTVDQQVGHVQGAGVHKGSKQRMRVKGLGHVDRDEEPSPPPPCHCGVDHQAKDAQLLETLELGTRTRASRPPGFSFAACADLLLLLSNTCYKLFPVARP